jgi:transcriptional regulator with PAS, ATPase and Fis domain
MLKITFVIPYPELEETVAKYLFEAQHQNLSFDTTHIVGVEDVKALKFDCDIIIARGITCAALREYHREITTVEIPVTGYDVIRALDECRKTYRARKVAVIGAGNMIYGAPSLNHILDVEVLVYRVENEPDAEQQIKDALSRGAEAIVGGMMVYNFAKSRDLPCTWIKSGPDAIKQAVDEAIRTADIKEREREKAEFFKIIMDYTHEGILAVDRDGRITALNKSARTILKKDGEFLGHPAGAVMPSMALLKVLDRGEEDLGALEIIGDSQVAANFVPIKVGNVVTGAVATFQNARRIQEIEGKIRKKMFTKGHTAKYGFRDIIGRGAEILSAIRTAEKYSRVDANVLITGETGTGKELFAHSIHNKSDRAGGPFVAVNCAALPENLLESELFGYVEGSFTGAMKGGKAGLFELAHDGTIFLDEVGEIPLPLQAKLLRVLQEREIMRIGDDRVIPVNVRILAATNKDLKARAAEGSFRQDILFRLDVLRVNVPPLRNREEDVPILLRHFLSLYGGKFSRTAASVSPRAMRMLQEYSWPGNVRELVNICERMSALTEGDVVDVDDVAREIGFISPPKNGAIRRGEALDSPRRRPASGSGNMREIEREAISSAMKECGNNLSLAARTLGISRTTLWRKCKTYNFRGSPASGL